MNVEILGTLTQTAFHRDLLARWVENSGIEGRCVVKLVQRRADDDSDWPKRIHAMGRFLAAWSDPLLPRVLGLWRDNVKVEDEVEVEVGDEDEVAIAIEYRDGVALSELPRRPLPWEAVIEVVLQVADFLGRMERLEDTETGRVITVRHRAISDETIFLEPGGTLRLEGWDALWTTAPDRTVATDLDGIPYGLKCAPEASTSGHHQNTDIYLLARAAARLLFRDLELFDKLEPSTEGKYATRGEEFDEAWRALLENVSFCSGIRAPTRDIVAMLRAALSFDPGQRSPARELATRAAELLARDGAPVLESHQTADDEAASPALVALASAINPELFVLHAHEDADYLVPPDMVFEIVAPRLTSPAGAASPMPPTPGGHEQGAPRPDPTDLPIPADLATKPDMTGEGSEVTRIGEWIVQDSLGSGSASTVYRCHHHLVPNWTRAVKLLRPTSDVQRAHLEEYFQREVRTLQQIAPHEGMVQTYASGRNPYYIVMDCVEGKHLDEHCSDLPWDDENSRSLRRLTLLLQCADALMYLHGRGLTHRDIKPANLLVESRTNQVKLVDFGLAVHREDPNLTQDINQRWGPKIFGTVRYLPPEVTRQAQDSRDPSRDVYALGVVAWEMLTQASAYEAVFANNVDYVVPLFAAKGAGPLTLPALDPDGEPFPPALGELVRDMTSPDPAARPSARDVVGRMRSILEDGWKRAPTTPPIDARPLAPEPPRPSSPGGTAEVAEPVDQPPTPPREPSARQLPLVLTLIALAGLVSLVLLFALWPERPAPPLSPPVTNTAPHAELQLSAVEVVVGDTLTAEASGSYDDNEGADLDFGWEVTGPGGSERQPAVGRAGQQASVQVDLAGTWTFTVTVRDEHGAQDSATHHVAARAQDVPPQSPPPPPPRPPSPTLTVELRRPQGTFTTGQPVELRGRWAGCEPDAPVTETWSLRSGPEGSAISPPALRNHGDGRATFTPAAPGGYRVRYQVTACGRTQHDELDLQIGETTQEMWARLRESYPQLDETLFDNPDTAEVAERLSAGLEASTSEQLRSPVAFDAWARDLHPGSLTAGHQWNAVANNVRPKGPATMAALDGCRAWPGALWVREGLQACPGSHPEGRAFPDGRWGTRPGRDGAWLDPVDGPHTICYPSRMSRCADLEHKVYNQGHGKHEPTSP